MISPTVDLPLSKRVAFLFRLRDWRQLPAPVTQDKIVSNCAILIVQNNQGKVSNIIEISWHQTYYFNLISSHIHVRPTTVEMCTTAQKKNIAKPPGAMERISASQTAWKLSLDGGLALCHRNAWRQAPPPLPNASCSIAMMRKWPIQSRQLEMREISENICKDKGLYRKDPFIQNCGFSSPKKNALVRCTYKHQIFWHVNCQLTKG